jgi:hypothetical protein
MVISPVAPNHDYADIYPKPSAHSRTIHTGIYNLAISNLARCSGTSSVRLYPLTNISANAVKNAIAATNQRYAFSVPKPCYYKEIVINYSKISPNEITTPASQVKGDPYTTTTELHYMVNPVTAATLTGKSDGGAVYNDAVDFKNNYIRFTMSAGLLTANDEQICDSTSAASVLATVKLFGEKRYVWFPMLNGVGEQIKDFFNDGCQKDNTREAILKNMRTASVALDDIEVIERYVANPKGHEQGVVLHAIAGLSDAVESLKKADTLPRAPNTPARPDITVVREELERSKNLVLTLASRTLEGMSQDQTAAKETRVHPLLNTYRYVAFSAAGSADCHGSQVGVDGP